MDALKRLFESHASLLLAGSVALLAFGAVLVPVAIARLPADYFVRSRRKHTGTLGLALSVLRNLAGVVLVVAGVLMLVLPGQGVLTILVGLSLLQFPGKRALELRLLRAPAIAGAINRLRRRAGKPPLRLDDTRFAAQ